MNAFLQQDRTLEVSDRLAIKHALAASANRQARLQVSLATDEVIQLGMLRTDVEAPGQGGPVWVSAVGPEMRRMLARAGVTLQAGTKYAVKQLDALFDKVDSPVEQRIALKHAFAEDGYLDEEASHPKAPVRKTPSSMSAAAPGKMCKLTMSCSTNDWDALR